MQSALWFCLASFTLASGLKQLSEVEISPAAGKHYDDPVEYLNRLPAGERYKLALHAVPDYVNRAEKKYGSPERAWKELWGNTDGVMSAAEWTRETQRLHMLPVVSWMAYQVLDADEDGTVTPEEFYAAVGEDGSMEKFAASVGPGAKLDAGAIPAAGPARGDFDYSRRFSDAKLVVDDQHAVDMSRGKPLHASAAPSQHHEVQFRRTSRPERSSGVVPAISLLSVFVMVSL